ncbi:unnamed protein product [Alternaria alternata]|jgi:hypothetical protein
MASNDLIAPIIVAIISLIGSFLSVLLSWYSQRESSTKSEKLSQDQYNQAIKLSEDQHNQTIRLQQISSSQTADLEQVKSSQTIALEQLKNQMAADMENFKFELERQGKVSDLTNRYIQPLVVAAYDLQQRLFDLVEYPISRQHLEKPEGLQDLKKFTCFLLARYLVAVYIMRTNTGYLSFSTDPDEKMLRKIMYLIDEELDRRRTRDHASRNIGVWPAARILISERMIIDKREVNSALDGGCGFDIKGLDQFLEQWDKKFKNPMGYFCETIDDMIDGRLNDIPHSDCALRVLQHLLVDVVKRLDPQKAYVTDGPNDMKCKKSDRGCDCDDKDCGGGKNLDSSLLSRRDSRWNDPGLWPKTGLDRAKGKFKRYNPNSDTKYSVEELQKMTHHIDIDWKIKE